MNKLLKYNFLAQKTASQSSDIEALQSHFSLDFPAAYTGFMITYGDVLFEAPLPNSVLVEIANKKLIAGVLGFLSPSRIYEIYQQLREDTPYADEPQIPKHMLPIVELVDLDEGDYIALNLKDGSVWATVFDYSIESESDTYGFIANDFQQFLDNIQTQEALEAQVGDGGDVLLGVYNLI